MPFKEAQKYEKPLTKEIEREILDDGKLIKIKDREVVKQREYKLPTERVDNTKLLGGEATLNKILLEEEIVEKTLTDIDILDDK